MSRKVRTKVVFLLLVVFFIFLEVQVASSSRRRISSRRRVIVTTRRRTCIPRSCTVTSWGNWGECQTKCGDGTKMRTRSIATSAYCGGSCSYTLSETTQCTDYTDRDCQVSPWSLWSSCLRKCPGDPRVRDRHITVETKCNGTCAYDLNERTVCNTTGWTNWNNCNATCNANGTMMRMNHCFAPKTLTEYASCVGTCCFTSCFEGFQDVGRYPQCDCVVDPGYKKSDGTGVYSFKQDIQNLLLLAVVLMVPLFD